MPETLILRCSCCIEHRFCASSNRFVLGDAARCHSLALSCAPMQLLSAGRLGASLADSPTTRYEDKYHILDPFGRFTAENTREMAQECPKMPEKAVLQASRHEIL